MKIRILSSKEEIESLGPKEEIIHLAFRPSNVDIFSLVTKCPEVRALHIPSSYYKTVSTSAKMYLQMQGIDLIKGDAWGPRKDLAAYSEISQNVYDCIAQYKAKGLASDEIVESVCKDTNMSPDIVKFLVKQNN